MPTLKLDQFLPYRLSVASNRVSAAIATQYQALFGLRIAEWRLVAVLAEGGAMSQQALGVATQMDKMTVSRACAALGARHLVARAPNPVDQRSQLLSLSDKGRALYEQVAPKALAIEAALLQSFDADERTALAGYLRRLEAAADRLGDDAGG